jgi:hypothetical protein
MFNTTEFIEYITNYYNRIIQYDFPIGVKILDRFNVYLVNLPENKFLLPINLNNYFDINDLVIFVDFFLDAGETSYHNSLFKVIKITNCYIYFEIITNHLQEKYFKSNLIKVSHTNHRFLSRLIKFNENINHFYFDI